MKLILSLLLVSITFIIKAQYCEIENRFSSEDYFDSNEIESILDTLYATALNVDYDKVVEYATLDSRLGDSHWAVPGPDGDFGFGGHCFPKDLAAIIKLCNTLDINPTVLNAVNKKNNEVRRDRDWEKMEGRAVV